MHFSRAMYEQLKIMCNILIKKHILVHNRWTWVLLQQLSYVCVQYILNLITYENDTDPLFELYLSVNIALKQDPYFDLLEYVL